MDKFCAYIGLAAALALAVMFLYPGEPESRYLMKATPFDNDGISAIIRSTSVTSKLMERTYDCVYRHRSKYKAVCQLSYFAPEIDYIYEERSALSKFVPDINKRIDEYFGQKYVPESPILISLQQDIVKQYPQIFSQYRNRYIVTTYMVHVIFLVLIGIMVWYRRLVGNSIKTIIISPFKLTGKVLASIHKRI